MTMRLLSKNIITYLPFVYYYIGPVSFISYLLAGRLILCRFKVIEIIFGMLFLAYFLMLFTTNEYFGTLYVLRLYWGFVLFYMLFKSGIAMQVDNLLIVLASITIIEALLINTVISAQLLPNFPEVEASSHFVEAGLYQRPYSFGGSASVTSVILVAFLSVSRLRGRGRLLVLSAIASCMSGSGFIAFIIYLIVRYPRTGYFLFLPAALVAAYSGDFYKISFDYIFFLLDFKLQQFTNDYSSAFLYLGEPFQLSSGDAGGDFAALTFLRYNGLVGVFMFFMIFVLNTNKINWLPLFILLAGSFHYGVVFFLPGQLALGYFLSLNKKHLPCQHE